MNLLPVALLSILPAALAQEPSVDQIMARVAENQTRAQDLRRAYIYNQKVVARFLRTNGKLARVIFARLFEPEERFLYQRRLSRALAQ